MTGYAISPDVAWLEAAEADGPEHVVWAARLDTAEQFEFTDTGWLIWMLLSDGVSTVPELQAELTRIHAELGSRAGAENIDRPSLLAFLDDLTRNGLLIALPEPSHSP
ncbi:hypothetical protein [Microbacterium sp. 22242]|uniref:hypothetical protein n=1 Tax=Microbacterium sp. 22242 TaxID=3453896 RepID=UPI003F82B543